MLTLNFLTGKSTPSEYGALVKESLTVPKPFNLIIGDFKTKEFTYVGGKEREVVPLGNKEFTAVVSNAALNTPWPKVVKLREALMSHNIDVIRATLLDTHRPEESLLPTDTGCTLDTEKVS
jgi:uncharacterized protein with NRDE domain